MSRIASWLLAIIVLAASVPAAAEPRHGHSAFGELKYARDFKHFDYVDPDAPKGGRLSQVGTGSRLTFDSFNPFILKGDAAQGIDALMFESLMVRALDEPDAVYGLIASSVDVAPDRLSVTFELRPEARFADGSALTAADVAFSFETLKAKGHPLYRSVLRDVVACEVLGPHHVRYLFTGRELRDLPLTVAELPVLSKAHYSATSFEETSLVPPLGSGPYRIADFKQGAFVSFRRRADHWARDLNVARGRFNFDEIRYEYFRDRTAALESFKAGDYDLREEFTARDWANAYDIPQVRDGRIQRLTVPDDSPSGAQGFFLNTRQPKFQDPRVRRALDLAFDYEWMNKNLFYGLYTRTASYFENSEMKASGLPSPAEAALLEPFRDRLPAHVFEAPYSSTVSDGSGTDRVRLRAAVKLLSDASWTIRTETADDAGCGTLCRFFRGFGLGNARSELVLRNAEGRTLDIEFLSPEPTFERILTPYVQSLALLGIKATVRRVDPAQYERRVKAFDFDAVTQRYSMRLTPGSELYNFFGSQAARTDGSFNLAGIADPVVDALISKVLAAQSRADLLTATRALDRVLRAGHYWVPHWHKASHNLAFWNRFGQPAVKPKYDRGIIDTWWYDAEKAAKLARKPPAESMPASTLVPVK